MKQLTITMSVPKGAKGENLLKAITNIAKVGIMLFMGGKKEHIQMVTDVDLDNNPLTDDYQAIITW